VTELNETFEHPGRWRGRSQTRLFLGVALISLGVAATSLSSTYSLPFLIIGPVTHAAGWLLLPGALWRRMLVLLPCVLAGLVLLGGVDFVGAFAVLLGGWLVVRRRPALSFLVLLLPIATSLVVKVSLDEYSDNLIALGVETLATVAGAWLAAWLHARLRLNRHARVSFVRTHAEQTGTDQITTEKTG